MTVDAKKCPFRARRERKKDTHNDRDREAHRNERG